MGVKEIKKVVLVGFGGHAKSVADSIEQTNKYQIVGYTDKHSMDTEYKYLGDDSCLRAIYESGVHDAVVCIGYLGKSRTREKIYELLKDIGYTLPVIVDPSATISKSATLGEGSFVGKGAVINADAKIGKMTIINTGAIIEHESIIVDFAHIAVGAVVCGGCVVGRSAFVGANATVIQLMQIAADTIIPAGEVIR